MRRLSTIFLITVMVLSISINSLASIQNLKDLADSKYKVEIEKLVEDGTINGYNDGTFKPQNGITRGELAKILAITLNLEEYKETAEHFTDVKGKWNQGFVGALYKANIMIGIGADEFGQDKNVTREELAVIVLRIFGLEAIANELDLEGDFSDMEGISSWAKKAVLFANKIGLMKSIDNIDGTSSFLPRNFGERELVGKLVYELKYNIEVYEEDITKIKESVNLKNSNNEVETDENHSEEKTTDNKPSYDSIVTKYKIQFSSLESSIHNELSSLISSAMEEYKNGGSASEIFTRYMDLANSLEASADSQVYSLLLSLSNELNSYGYNTSIVSNLQAQYESAKEAARIIKLP